jgi:hypothetical protein
MGWQILEEIIESHANQYWNHILATSQLDCNKIYDTHYDDYFVYFQFKVIPS